jgi:hypothetical protein
MCTVQSQCLSFRVIRMNTAIASNVSLRAIDRCTQRGDGGKVQKIVV